VHLLKERLQQIAAQLDPKQLSNAVVVNENGPVLSATNIHYEIAQKTKGIAHGGIGAIHQMVNKLGLAKQIIACRPMKTR
jgi:hypothetical protein